MVDDRPDRAVLFIDGNNWYHSLREAGVENPRRLSYSRMSQKLVGGRQWVETRYYIGALKQHWNPTAYSAQRAFLSLIQRDDPRITVHLGRLERRVHENPLAAAVLRYADDPRTEASAGIRNQLRELATSYRHVETLKEKAVDSGSPLASLNSTGTGSPIATGHDQPDLRLCQL